MFTVTALVDGAFKEVSLSDYLGQKYRPVFFSLLITVSDLTLLR
jgi:hypothetical protein